MLRSTSFDKSVIFEFESHLGLWAGASFDKGKTWDSVDTDREQKLEWDETTDFTDLSESHSFMVPENLLQYLDTQVAHYGLVVPRWAFFNGFDHEQCSIHPDAFRAVLAHLRPMYPMSSPELLGQTVGFFAWQCEYKFDKALDRVSGEWFDTDEFNNPLAQPPSVKEHFGDCEDMSRLMQLTFDKLCESHLLDTWTRKYYCFSIDVVIRESQLHQCVILVPKATVHHIWLNGYEVKTPEDVPAEDVNKFPLLVLESTEWTLTNFKTKPSALVDALADDNVPDKIAFPYPGEAYRREKYFTTFLTAYCQELHRLSGVASWHLITEHTNVLGVSLDDLVDQRNVVIAPWQLTNPKSLRKCDKFFNKYTARLYDIPAPPPPETKKSTEEKRVVPIYTFADIKREDIERWSKAKCISSRPEILRGVGLRDLYVWYIPIL